MPDLCSIWAGPTRVLIQCGRCYWRTPLDKERMTAIQSVGSLVARLNCPRCSSAIEFDLKELRGLMPAIPMSYRKTVQDRRVTPRYSKDRRSASRVSRV